MIEGDTAFRGLSLVVPARLSSSRLPGKVLRRLAGRPALEHLAERARRSAIAAQPILCTTEQDDDDDLVVEARRLGFRVVRGSTDDLLARLLQAAREHSLQGLVIVEGDDILVDPQLIDLTAGALVAGADFTKVVDVPLGATPIGLSRRALERVCRERDTGASGTGWGRFFSSDADLRRVDLQPPDPAMVAPELRLTLDYEEDAMLLEEILRSEPQGDVLGLVEIVAMLRREPSLRALNASRDEEYWANFEAEGGIVAGARSSTVPGTPSAR